MCFILFYFITAKIANYFGNYDTSIYVKYPIRILIGGLNSLILVNLAAQMYKNYIKKQILLK